MKRFTTVLALVLCLVLCVFAFASCNKDKKKGAASTTAKATAAPSTTAAPATTEAEETMAPNVHVIPDEWEDEYLVAPDCTDEGMKVKYCPECGEIVATESVPADPNAHKVASWTVTEAVNMFHTTGSREGVCTSCHQNIVEVIKFEPTVETFTSMSGQYNTEKTYFADVRGENHFYPTDTDPDGNDLLVEFSVLWNESILNFDGSANCYMCGRFDKNGPFYYFSPVAGCPTSDADVDGAFEWMGNFKTPISDAEVTTPLTMMSASSNYADYPNINGADPDHPEYGWHRVGVRYHFELLDGKSGEDMKDYRGIVTVYLDGVAIYKLSTGDLGMQDRESHLFNAVRDGDTVTYTDADNWIIPFQINRAKAKASTTVYFVYADLMVTCGKNFAMPVQRVATPAAATFTLDDNDTPDDTTDDVTCPAGLYFKLAD